jgi:hypothetical protein
MHEGDGKKRKSGARLRGKREEGAIAELATLSTL